LAKRLRKLYKNLLLENINMPTLTIQNLPDPVHAALRALAAQDGLSVEAEACRILATVCMNDKQPAASLQQLIEQLYQGKKTGSQVERLLQERRREAKNE
jgi:plasmid stability protein